MDLEIINVRVDKALDANRRAERIIIVMAIALFIFGLLVLSAAYWLKNPYVASGSVLMQGFLVFPVSEVKKLRRDNLILQTFPALIDVLPPAGAASEIKKLLAHLRGSK
jgi:hypothetical protein